MKIVASKSVLVPFKDISCGEVFKDHSGCHCMRTETCVLVSGRYINYVSLVDGAVGFALADSEFQKVDCELVIK